MKMNNKILYLMIESFWNKEGISGEEYEYNVSNWVEYRIHNELGSLNVHQLNETIKVVDDIVKGWLSDLGTSGEEIWYRFEVNSMIENLLGWIDFRIDELNENPDILLGIRDQKINKIKGEIKHL